MKTSKKSQLIIGIILLVVGCLMSTLNSTRDDYLFLLSIIALFAGFTVLTLYTIYQNDERLGILGSSVMLIAGVVIYEAITLLKLDYILINFSRGVCFIAFLIATGLAIYITFVKEYPDSPRIKR